MWYVGCNTIDIHQVVGQTIVTRESKIHQFGQVAWLGHNLRLPRFVSESSEEHTKNDTSKTPHIFYIYIYVLTPPSKNPPPLATSSIVVFSASSAGLNSTTYMLEMADKGPKSRRQFDELWSMTIGNDIEEDKYIQKLPANVNFVPQTASLLGFHWAFKNWILSRDDFAKA